MLTATVKQPGTTAKHCGRRACQCHCIHPVAPAASGKACDKETTSRRSLECREDIRAECKCRVIHTGPLSIAAAGQSQTYKHPKRRISIQRSSSSGRRASVYQAHHGKMLPGCWRVAGRAGLRGWPQEVLCQLNAKHLRTKGNPGGPTLHLLTQWAWHVLEGGKSGGWVTRHPAALTWTKQHEWTWMPQTVAAQRVCEGALLLCITT